MPKTTYYWDELSDNVAAEYEDGILSASYTHEPGLYGNLLSQNRNGVTSYYHYDGRGDTVALTDDSGDVTDTKEYDAWGNVISSTGTTSTPYQFLGRSGYQTGIGGIYVRARLYEPILMRWSCIDPQRFIDGINLFLYGWNNPGRRTDPSGLKVICCECSALRFVPHQGPVGETTFEKLICLSGSAEQCCANECRMCDPNADAYSTAVHPVYPELPPANRRPAPQRKPNNRGGYGHYCGPRAVSNACLENKCAKSCLSRHVPNYPANPAPIDKLDAICEIHDCCYGTVGIVLACRTECDKKTCEMMRAIKCELLYKVDAQGPEFDACLTMKRQFIFMFC